MAKEQVKFYVTEDEKRRLEVLAKLRFMSVPTYAKVTALGVKIQQVKETFVEYKTMDERLFDGSETIVGDEDKQVLEEIINRSTKKGFIQYDASFNERLQEMAKRLLGQ